MIKLRLAAVAAIMGAIAAFSPAAAQASGSYVDVVVILTADTPRVGGTVINFKATTTAGNIDCDWTVNWSDGVAGGEDPVRTGSGFTLTGSYDSKVVQSSTPTTMTATCEYDDGFAKASAAVSSLQNASDSTTVVLLPKGGNTGGEDPGALPNTGGSNLSWLLIGGALVVAGAGVTYAARRGNSAR